MFTVIPRFVGYNLATLIFGFAAFAIMYSFFGKGPLLYGAILIVPMIAWILCHNAIQDAKSEKKARSTFVRTLFFVLFCYLLYFGSYMLKFPSIF